MRSPRHRILAALVLMLVPAAALGGCAGVSGVPVAVAPLPPLPASSPALSVEYPGDGGTVDVPLGRVIAFPVEGSRDGYRFSDTGVLVAYGSLRNWLTTRSGPVPIAVFEPDSSGCPQQVGTFTLLVSQEGTAPAVPAPVPLPDGRSVTVHSVPGQRLDIPFSGDRTYTDQSATYLPDGRDQIAAFAPGTDEYTLYDNAREVSPVVATVVVDGPRELRRPAPAFVVPAPAPAPESAPESGAAVMARCG